MSDTARVARRNIIPDPIASEEEADRFHHRDIATLCPEEIHAERLILTPWLADRIFHKVKSKLVCVTPQVDDLSWARDRLDRLRRAAADGRRA